MEIATVLYFVRVAVCLAGGFWLARKMRGMIPAIVLRLMPPKHRFSENAFRIQTRISTAVAVVLTLGGAVLINEGIEWAVRQARTQTRTAFTPSPTPPISMSPAPLAVPSPVTDYDWSEPAFEEDAPPPRRTSPPAKEGAWCFQLYALNEEENALQEQAVLSRRLPRQVRVAYLPGDKGPYKVYVSGFSDRDEAVRFGKKNQLKGFPRPAHQLRQYAE
jgi:hypothetical protein